MDSVLEAGEVFRASRLLDKRRVDDADGLGLDALRGQLTEFTANCGHPQITLAARQLVESHRAGEPAAWIGPSDALPYPPDVARGGIDWSALALIHSSQPQQASVAADKLLRSGGFGLVVVDLIGMHPARIADPLAGRLLRLAEHHDSAVVFLTRNPDGSGGVCSLVALRVRARWADTGAEQLRMVCQITRDKRGGRHRRIEEVYDGALRLR